MFRENRVPYYQRLFQNHDGKRQWWKVSLGPIDSYAFNAPRQISNRSIAIQTSRSAYIMWPYLATTYALGAGKQTRSIQSGVMTEH